jgi:hypothetical protein
MEHVYRFSSAWCLQNGLYISVGGGKRYHPPVRPVQSLQQRSWIEGAPFVYFLHRSTKDDDLLWHVSCPAYLFLASPVTSSLGLPDLAIEDRRLTMRLQLWGGASEARSGVDLHRPTRLACGANLRRSARQNESSGFSHRESQVLGENCPKSCAELYIRKRKKILTGAPADNDLYGF